MHDAHYTIPSLFPDRRHGGEEKVVCRLCSLSSSHPGGPGAAVRAGRGAVSPTGLPGAGPAYVRVSCQAWRQVSSTVLILLFTQHKCEAQFK